MPLDPKSTTPDGTDNAALWRKTFPIDTADEVNRSRRDFVGGVGVACGALACGQVAIQAVGPTSHANEPSDQTAHVAGEPLPKNWQDMAVGEAQLFHYPNEKTPCLLVKLDEQSHAAFAQKCTHLCCPVIPEFEKSEFHCPCHHGSFDLRTGEPLAGPPRSPLPKVTIEISDDGVIRPIGIS